jgi:hypothetical protein
MTMTQAEYETLREMGRYDYYVFRQATAAKLEAKGWAECIDPEKKRPGRRITQAGRDALKEAMKGRVLS